jgi:hypothetical protein
MFITSDDKKQLMEIMVKIVGQDPPSRPIESYMLEAQTEEKRYIQRMMFDTSMELAKAIISSPGFTIAMPDEVIANMAWEITERLAIKSGLCIDGGVEGEED